MFPVGPPVPIGDVTSDGMPPERTHGEAVCCQEPSAEEATASMSALRRPDWGVQRQSARAELLRVDASPVRNFGKAIVSSG